MRHRHFLHTDTAVHPTADGNTLQDQFDHLVRCRELHGSMFYHTSAPDQTSPKRWQQLHAASLGFDRDENRRESNLKLANAAILIR
jgi:hypothetical protein